MDLSTGAELPATLRLGNQQGTIKDPGIQDPNQVTQSTILHLLQEATKLAPPADNNNPSDSRPKQGSVSHKPAPQPGSSLRCLRDQSKNDCERHGNAKSVQSSARCRSPWEVMRLINLQCERLLHSHQLEDEDGSSSSTAFSTSVLDVADKGLGYSLGSVSSTGPVCSSLGVERECPSYFGSSNGSQTPSVTKELWHTTQYSVRADIAVKAQTFNGDFRDSVSSDFGEPVDMRVPLGNGTKIHTNEGYEEDGCGTVEHEMWKEPCSEAVISPRQTSSASDDIPGPLDPRLACGSTEVGHASAASPSMATVTYLSSSVLTCDFNNNLRLAFNPKQDTQQVQSSSQAQSLILSGETGGVSSTSNQNGGIGASKPELKLSHSASHQSPSPESQWRTKTPRKQPKPARSVDVRGGDVQGVVFRIHTELDDSKEQCRLIITSKYSGELSRSKSRVRSRSSQSSLRTSSSEEESERATSLPKNKICASCCTKETPMWRDAEDGTPLCNACGIRYKKYRVRCPQCWHIPRKEGNSNSRCLKCGDLLRLATSHRKHTAW